VPPRREGPRPWIYRDRAHAGRALAALLAAYAGRDDVIVLALPRGGVPVAYPIARTLGAPLDILAVRKLGVPGHEELAMGAVAEGGVRVLNQDVVSHLAIDVATVDAVTRAQLPRLEDQETRFRADRQAAPRQGRKVVLVDDGLATGSTMEAAIASCRRAGAAQIVVAVPVGASSTVARLKVLAEEVVCPETPAHFRAVGLAYQEFERVADADVVALLSAASEGGR